MQKFVWVQGASYDLIVTSSSLDVYLLFQMFFVMFKINDL